MSYSSRPLLHRSSLQPGESLSSFLIRLAQENYYHSPTMVMQLCRERLPWRDQVTRPARAETYRVLAELTKVEIDELYMACAQRFAAVFTFPGYKQRSVLFPSGKTMSISTNSVLREQTRPQSDVQFCPLCLNETAYHRIDWLPLVVTVCLRHQCLLIHGCPNCHRKTSVQDVLEARCPRCGFELTQAPIISMVTDQFGLLSQSLIQSWLGLCSPTSINDCGALPDESPATLYRFLDGLRRTVMNIQRNWNYLHDSPSGVGSPLFPCTSKSDVTPAKAYILYATAFKAMVNWPNGFYDFLRAYRQRDNQLPSSHIRRDLGRLYSYWLARAWKYPEFQFVQEAFDHYVARG